MPENDLTMLILAQISYNTVHLYVAGVDKGPEKGLRSKRPNLACRLGSFPSSGRYLLLGKVKGACPFPNMF